MMRWPCVARWIGVVLVGGALAACGGGSETSTAPTPVNPDSGTEGQPPPVSTPLDPAIGAVKTQAIGGHAIALIDTGAPTDKPLASTIVLLHEFGNSSVQWSRLTPLLSPDFRVIAPDLRGHGNSPLDVCCHRLTDYTSDLNALLNELQISKVMLLGSGGGGLIAQQFAVQYADRVDHLVLIGSDSTALDNPDYEELSRLAQSFTNNTASDEFLSRWNATAASPSADALAAIAALRVAQSAVKTPVWQSSLTLMSTSDTASVLANISAPTLQLTGANDPLFGPNTQHRLADALKSEVRLSIADAGRYPSIEQVHVVADTIKQFASPRGRLHRATEVANKTVSQIDAVTAGGVQRFFLREITGAADCHVRIYNIQYQTIGAAGESTTASAGVAVPYGERAVCQGPRPTVLYAHGTSSDKHYSVLTSTEGFGGVALAVFAARGFIVIAPNYTGYGNSWLNYHPYLQAQAQADDMIDALRAGKSMLGQINSAASDKLFITGYSQGGFVAMATHRQIESHHAGELAVTASYPMSGPYALADTVTQVLQGRLSDDSAALVSILRSGYQHTETNSGMQAADLFETPYHLSAANLFPGDIGTEQSVSNGLLPPHLLATQGSPYLLRPDFVSDYLSNSDNAFRRAMTDNQLLNWTPSAPIALCVGGKDPVVFADNTYAAQQAFAARGINAPITDFDEPGTFNGGFTNTLYLKFKAIATVLGNDPSYHSALAPFCARLARDFFTEQLRQ